MRPVAPRFFSPHLPQTAKPLGKAFPGLSSKRSFHYKRKKSDTCPSGWVGERGAEELLNLL